MWRNILLFSTLLLLLSGCAKPRVETDYDLKTDFTAPARTWTLWQQRQKSECGDLNRDELEQRRFYAALTDALQAKGYAKAENPAWLVTIGYRVSSVVQEEPGFRPGMSIGVGRGGWGFGMGGLLGRGGSTVRRSSQAEVVVSFYSTATKQLSWRGSAQASPPESNATPQQRNSRAQELVAAVLKDFPPEQKK